MAKEGCNELAKFSLVTSTDTLRGKLWHAQQQGKFSDFQIKVNNVPIACHKVVLAEQCDYFSCMLQHESSLEVSQGFVDMRLLNADAVKLVIGFIYSGGIEVEFHMIQEVIKVVNYFQLNDKILEEKISEYIITNLCPENCLGWLKFGDQLNLEKVQQKAESIMMEKFDDVSKGPEFVELTFIQLTDYIQKLVQRHNRHDQALQAFVRWAMHDATNRGHMFEESMQVVDLNKCCASVLKDIYEKHGKVLLDNCDVLHRFTAALSCAASKPSYDIIVTGGLEKFHKSTPHSFVRNRSTWVVNLASGSIVEKASQTMQENPIILCAYPNGFISVVKKPLPTDTQFDCVLYNKNTDTWEVLAPFPDATRYASATCVGDELLMVIGGKESRKNKVLCLDLKTKSFVTCRDMPQGMICPIVESLGACVFVIFSDLRFNREEQRGTVISLQCYDTTTDSWTFKSPLPDSIKNTAASQAITMAGLLYLVGRDFCARYDPVCNNWTVLAPPRGIHAFGAVLVVNNKIILSGGSSEELTKKQRKGRDSIEEYEPCTDTWRVLPVKLPARLFTHGMTLV